MSVHSTTICAWLYNRGPLSRCFNHGQGPHSAAWQQHDCVSQDLNLGPVCLQKECVPLLSFPRGCKSDCTYGYTYLTHVFYLSVMLFGWQCDIREVKHLTSCRLKFKAVIKLHWWQKYKHTRVLQLWATEYYHKPRGNYCLVTVLCYKSHTLNNIISKELKVKDLNLWLLWKNSFKTLKKGHYININSIK